MANGQNSFDYDPIPDSHRVVMPGAEAIGSANPHQNIEVSIKLRRKNALPDFSERPAKLLTREELADSYGASHQDIDADVGIFTKLGLKNTFTDDATRTVQFPGSGHEQEHGIQVKLFHYTHPDE